MARVHWLRDITQRPRHLGECPDRGYSKELALRDSGNVHLPGHHGDVRDARGSRPDLTGRGAEPGQQRAPGLGRREPRGGG